ncbi:MAG: PH domain-containing protein [bacterium]|nr:PH domain-containing protein [bacterium]
MNNQYSALQQQFPLSPRKFWKKVLPKIPFCLIIATVGVMLTFFISVVTDDNTFNPFNYIAKPIFFSLILFLAAFIPYAWYVKIYIKKYYYDAGDNFVTIKKGVFAPTEIHVQYQKIQDVYVDQDILDRLMGIYDVHIASATVTSGIEAHIDGVDARGAEGLKNLLLNKISGTAINNVATVNNHAKDSGSIKFSLNEKISDQTYPISLKWLYLRIIQSFVYCHIQFASATLWIKFIDI